jgi:hypothetical protein
MGGTGTVRGSFTMNNENDSAVGNGAEVVVKTQTIRSRRGSFK